VAEGRPAQERPTQALRWAALTATGSALLRPGRLYYARLAGPGAASAVLRDGVDATGAVLLGLALPAAGVDEWPPLPISIVFMKGLHVTLTGTATVSLGWEAD
jgi:hypothetical protein